MSVISAPLSQTQTGIFTECMQHPDGKLYLIAFLYKLHPDTDPGRLEDALRQTVKAHPSILMRMRVNEEGVPEQWLGTEAVPDIATIRADSIDGIRKHLVQPMPMTEGPLALFRFILTPECNYFLLQVHHAISDGTSLNVFVRDMDSAYLGREPEGEDLTAQQYALWEQKERSGEAWLQDKAWSEAHILSDEAETVIPGDLSGDEPGSRRFEMALSVKEHDVRQFCQTRGAKKSTLFTVAYALLMSRYTGNDNVLFSTIWHGRASDRLARTFGMFVRTLPAAFRLRDDMSVDELLAQGADVLSEARAHTLYSFSDFCHERGVQPATMFVCQGKLFNEVQLGGHSASWEDLDSAPLSEPLVAELCEEGEGYSIRFQYHSHRYSEAFLQGLAESYSQLLGQMIQKGGLLRDLSILSAAQEEVLDRFNETDSPFDERQTVVSAFRRIAAEYPQKTAVVFRERRLTYRDADDVSDRLSAVITARGLGREDVVAVLIPRSEWMATVSLGILKAGCAYLPLDASYPKERLAFMLEDAGARLLIADRSLAALTDDWQGERLMLDELEALPAATALPEGPLPESLFTLLYTSGTTGVPKGCQVEHRNVTAFCHMHRHCHELTADARVGAYASYGFDASVMELFATLTTGAELHIIPEELRLDLAALHDYIEANGLTHIFMTTQVAYQFATNFTAASLRRLMTGGEKLPALTPPEGYTVANGYGPSESICYVTNFNVTQRMEDIPIGSAQRNVKCYVVDRRGHRQPAGAAGELWIASPQVTRGYLHQPERTAEAFTPNPFSKQRHYERVYHTGDIVAMMPDGNLRFVGRRDGQVKIRGFRIEIKEVEAVIRQYPGISDVTVQAFDYEGGGKYIVAYVVSDSTIDTDALHRFIAGEKPPYMVPAVTMQIGRIPLNQNQKVDRRALPRPEHTPDGEKTPTANVPMNLLEEQLYNIVEKLVGHGDFDLTTPLNYAGVTSIMAIKLAVQLNRRIGVKLNPKSIMKGCSLHDIENEILRALLEGGPGAAPAEGDTTARKAAGAPFPLTYAQTGVYFDCMKHPTSIRYNIPTLVSFPESLDSNALADAVKRAVALHPQFSVHFGNEGTETVQIPDPGLAPAVNLKEMSEEELTQYRQDFVRPFNLKQGPLYRMEVVRTEQRLCLLSDMHHLIADGISFDLFLRQVCTLVDGGSAEPEEVSYAAFAEAERDARNQSAFAEAHEFFDKRLSGIEGVTELPSDLSNPTEGGERRRVSAPLHFERIEAFCRSEGITPAHLTLAAAFYALSRFSGNGQLCITTISNGRSDLRLMSTVGMFVNTLALTARVEHQSVRSFLHEVRDDFEATLAHEQYPFARIAADYGLTADILFAYQMGVIEPHSCMGQPVTAESMEAAQPKFRIALYIEEENGQPSVCIDYDDGRYSHSLIHHLARAVSLAAEAFANDPSQALMDVELTDDEQRQELSGFNATDSPYDESQTIVSLFRKQAAMTPDRPAVVFGERCLSYRETDAVSERIALYVHRLGLGPEDVVSILIPRSEWMATASLGVLKAGSAYQPLDPSYPKERLNFMMKDAGAKLLIADRALRPLVDEYDGEVLFTDAISTLPEATEPLPDTATPENLFILLYTSGSTGVPKGCQLEQRNITAFCHWYRQRLSLTPDCRVAAYASYGFDACMMDLWPALTSGACVDIISEDLRLNLPELNTYFERHGVTHSFITTQVGYQFAVNVNNHSLRHFLVGGEKLSSLNPPTSYLMHNGYGPTECTVFTTTYTLSLCQQDIPIGRPLDNLRLYVVDAQGHLLPLGALGELWVSGPQVGRGYLNRPDLNDTVFIANPFDNDPQHSRIYRTGDIVRWMSDGNIQFVGRRDGQVKIRGFRIELKEVEAVIRQFPGIGDVTVQAFDHESGGKFIAAYIVSNETVDTDALRDFIGRHKPSYMVPAALMQIERIPLNQNQKVNRRALPAPVLQSVVKDYTAPATETEKIFCDIFADVLALERVSATDNFFDLGGTSLMVTRVIIEADRHGRPIAYGDLFSHPTPRLLGAFLSDLNSKGETDGGNDAEYDYSAINDVLASNTLEAFRQGTPQTLGRVLLTGATGYLGIHVLHELIGRDDVPHIFCLVRGESREKAESRLKNLLFYYFGHNFKTLFGSRLSVVPGDVTQEIETDETVDTVINCAAVVKHFSSGTEIEDVNVRGAAHCVRFCMRTGARLIHISTYSTAGLSVNGTPGPDAVLTEQRLFYGQSLDNRYVHSKFVSERLVLEAIAHSGLNAKVMRVGNLAPRSTDGEFQINFQTNAALGRVRVYRVLGCYPYGQTDDPMEFSPINEVAHAIVTLAVTPRECCLFHPFNNHSVHLGDVLNELRLIGEAPRQVEAADFTSALEQSKQQPDKARFLQSLLAYQDMAHGGEVRPIATLNSYTTQVLYRLGFRWSPTSWDYVDRFLTALDGLGYFEQ